MKFLLSKSLFAGAAALAIVPSAFAQGFLTSQQAYLVPTPTSDYTITPIITVGEFVPLTGGTPDQAYRMVGIPDGIGAAKGANGTTVVFLNHEFVNTVASTPMWNGSLNSAAGTLNNGTADTALRGAFVSKFILNSTAGVISGAPAYSRVYQDDTLVGNIQTALNPAVRGFGRFCSGALAGTEAGFDRPIYFANEETGGSTSAFSSQGAQTVAVFDNNGAGEAHALSYLGFFPWENALVMPRRDAFTVIMGNEDGPTTTDSQLYMYVGRKTRSSTATVLQRNGLVNGRLYVLVPKNTTLTTEATFNVQNTSINCEWKEIANANTLTDVQTEAAADALGAFGFVRIEDGSFDGRNPTRDYYFVSTGSSSGGENELGRLYHLRWSNPSNPLSDGVLTLVVNADTVDGGAANLDDFAFSPDNMDNNASRMMICEDGTTESRLEMTARNRDGMVWSLDFPAGTPMTTAQAIASKHQQAELNPPAPAPHNQAVTAGIWESSGVVDSSKFFGADTWLVDVQAHSPTTTETGTVENGQLLLMRPAGALETVN